MNAIMNHLATGSLNLAPLEILHASPGVLLAVSPLAVASLKTLEIDSVFDLASSPVFANANALVDAAENRRALYARFGLPPADVLEALPAGMAIDQLARQPIAIQEDIGTTLAAAVGGALHVQTVRDLALWSPYLAARDILQRVLVPDAVSGAMALSVEAGELLEHFQWLADSDTAAFDDQRQVAIGEEMADVLICLADTLEIDLAEAATAKVEKNAEKYPTAKCADRPASTRTFDNEL